MNHRSSMVCFTLILSTAAYGIAYNPDIWLDASDAYLRDESTS